MGDKTQGVTKVDKFKIKLPDGKIVTHPAFVRDGEEIDCFYVGPIVSEGKEVAEIAKRQKEGTLPEGMRMLNMLEADALGKVERGEVVGGLWIPPVLNYKN
ncbi:hypothetical protein [Desulfotruncus alcoholivorax]|uniref:hypothetical protein n=1 Tax=Desulfotruncus alcoholivorax TaxID=265477 RepID=UPI0004811E27|nr:hypothetical protein [Desulfotruncus alcoholivorax]